MVIIKCMAQERVSLLKKISFVKERLPRNRCFLDCTWWNIWKFSKSKMLILLKITELEPVCSFNQRSIFTSKNLSSKSNETNGVIFYTHVKLTAKP